MDCGSCTYEPWHGSNGEVGYKVTRKSDGRVEYVYLNPSDDEGADDPNVFVYIGTEGDPCQDGAAHHYLLFE